MQFYELLGAANTQSADYQGYILHRYINGRDRSVLLFIPRFADVTIQLLIEEFQRLVKLGREIRAACRLPGLSASERRFVIGESKIRRLMLSLALLQCKLIICNSYILKWNTKIARLCMTYKMKA